MEYDHVLLSRLQFAFTVTLHIIFPAFTIGLASFLVVLQGMWMKTRDYAYLDLREFWLKIFAVSFGMGVVSGIVMSFQFGTNWSGLSDAAGNVIGPLITYETTTAFFLEATFLGVMLFGRGKLPEGVHFFAGCMVALGTLGSAFWILSANSWLQTPAGFELRDGIFYVDNWLEVIFNPSFPYRFFHMVIGAFITTALVVAGVGAWYRLTKRAPREARIMLSMALWLLTILVPAQIVVGHLSGVAMGENQPVKMAAVEARWETEQPASLVLIGWPDAEQEKNLYAIVIPGIGGLIDTGKWDAVMPGLKSWPPEDRPPVIIPFFTFRIMVGCAIDHVAGRGLGPVPAARRAALSFHAVPGAHPARQPARLRRRGDRLVHRRGRAPALGGLQPPEDRRRGLAGAARKRRLLSQFAASGLHHRVRRRGLLHSAPDRQGNRCLATRDRALGAHRQAAPVRHRPARHDRGVRPVSLEFALPLIWAGILAFGVFMYVVMDGFDLGVGILYGFARSEAERRTMMNSVAPIWDGNETWLILGGAGLWAAFPVAYSTILPALYIPLFVMLVALIFRGVAFEFRFKATRMRWFWDLGFTVGSTVATFAQGVVLGAFIEGIKVEDRAFAGGPFDWLSIFSLATGLALVFGYALLGTSWLIMKTEGPIQEKAFGRTVPLLLIVLGFIVTVSVITPVVKPEVAQRWFAWPDILYLGTVPFFLVVVAFTMMKAINDRQERLPFVLSILLFLLSYLGIAISLWPHVIPPDITIWEAASPVESQFFLLVGVLVLVPVILCYTAFSYYVFRGKVHGDEGYH